MIPLELFIAPVGVMFTLVVVRGVWGRITGL